MCKEKKSADRILEHLLSYSPGNMSTYSKWTLHFSTFHVTQLKRVSGQNHQIRRGIQQHKDFKGGNKD